jgi:hypothetical protein
MVWQRTKIRECRALDGVRYSHDMDIDMPTVSVYSLTILLVKTLRWAKSLIMVAEYTNSRYESPTKPQEPRISIGFDEGIGITDMKLKMSIGFMRQNKDVAELTESWLRGSGRYDLVLGHQMKVAFLFWLKHDTGTMLTSLARIRDMCTRWMKATRNPIIALVRNHLRVATSVSADMQPEFLSIREDLSTRYELIYTIDLLDIGVGARPVKWEKLISNATCLICSIL